MKSDLEPDPLAAFLADPIARNMAKRVLRETTEALHALDTWLWTLDDEANVLRLSLCGDCVFQAGQQPNVSIAGSFIGMVLDTGHWGISGTDTGMDVDFESLLGSGVHSMIAAPLEIDAEVLGVICCIRHRTPDFTPEDSAMLGWKTALAGVAIANASRVPAQALGVLP